jgi:hypothetical protein
MLHVALRMGEGGGKLQEHVLLVDVSKKKRCKIPDLVPSEFKTLRDAFFFRIVSVFLSTQSQQELVLRETKLSEQY